MIKIIKRELKKYFRQALRTVICFQLCFIPCYSYSADEKINPENTGSSSYPESMSSQSNKGGNLEVVETILALSEAIETGKVEEFLRNNPKAAENRDHFLLANQSAESIEHHFDSKKRESIEKAGIRIQLNHYTSSPIHKMFKDIHVRFNDATRELVFEGISEGVVQLRQSIPNMDIIDYVHDKEFLLLLDKNKGLLLVDVLFARAYLGLSPVPIIRLPVPILENLKAYTGLSIDKVKDSLSMEFINHSIRPPDVLPKGVENIGKSFQNHPLFMAGDMMISYTDQNNQKHIVHFFKRIEIAGWVRLNYDILDIMTKVIVPHLMQSKDLAELKQKLAALTERGTPQTMQDHIVSSLFVKNAVHKLSQVAQGIKIRVSQLEKLPTRESMLFHEWQRLFSEVSSKMKKQKDQMQDKIEGNVLSTKEIVDLYATTTEEEKTTRARAIRIMAHIMSTPRKIGNFVNKHRLTVTTVGGGSLAGYFYPELFVFLTNEILPAFNNLNYKSGHSSYLSTSIPNLLTLFVFLPGFVMLMGFLHKPFVKVLKRIAPEVFSVRSKTFYPKGFLEDHLKKWENTGVLQKIVGVGMRLVAYAIYPFWNYIGRIVGQPHLLTAIQKGLNPLKKIALDSDVGEVAQIKKSARLGSQGLKPIWTKSSDSFKEHEQLQEVALAKEQRMKSIAWLMASLAVSEKMNVNPGEILIYGATANTDKLKKVHNDPALKEEVFWVMRNLLKEIRKLDELDIRKELIELEPKLLVKYYERALALAQEVREHPEFRNKIHNILSGQFMFSLIQKGVSANKVQHDLLKNVPTDFVTGRVGLETIVDHLMTTFLPLIATDRSSFRMEHFSQSVVNENNHFWSGNPHLTEVAMNIMVHLFIAGAQKSMIFTKPESVIGIVHGELHDADKKDLYGVSERHTREVRDQHQGEWDYYKKQFAYIASGGKEGNLGDIMLKSYIARFRSIQMGLSLMVVLRMLIGSQSFTEAILGALLFHFAGHWMFGWPWDIIHGGANLNEKQLNENRKKMESLRLKLSKISRGAYEQETDLKKEYREALIEIMDLYNQSPLKKTFLKRVQTLEVNLQDLETKASESLSVSKGIQDIQFSSEKLAELIAEYPPLPTKKNRLADASLTSIFGAALTTYLFVTLSVWTFSPDYLNLKYIGLWALANYALYGFFKFGYSKGLKGHRESFKNLKKYWSSRKEWTRRWSSYFYDGVLDLSKDIGKSIKSTCHSIWK